MTGKKKNAAVNLQSEIATATMVSEHGQDDPTDKEEVVTDEVNQMGSGAGPSIRNGADPKRKTVPRGSTDNGVDPQKVQHLEGQFDHLEGYIGGMVSRFDNLEARFTRIEKLLAYKFTESTPNPRSKVKFFADSDDDGDTDHEAPVHQNRRMTAEGDREQGARTNRTGSDRSRARHILCEKQVKINEAHKKLQDGWLSNGDKVPPAEFAKVASEYSECPSGKKGGDLGWFSRGKMAGPFQDVAFSTPVGATGTPFKSTHGYHIILCEGRKN